jgi:hypothetical protein
MGNQYKKVKSQFQKQAANFSNKVKQMIST